MFSEKQISVLTLWLERDALSKRILLCLISPHIISYVNLDVDGLYYGKLSTTTLATMAG